ncbi:hypothetical protein V1277_006889 [Bradyrhizobium sp. AZCC 1588]|uniref:hypothetical protein n=1 Tax=unclassified Bradyrhizobium TaxID=2631580 RepID=UPI002FEF99E6
MKSYDQESALVLLLSEGLVGARAGCCADGFDFERLKSGDETPIIVSRRLLSLHAIQ